MPDGQFPPTRWTLIARLKSGDEAAKRAALEELCAVYHYPLYCYIRRRGLEHHDAQDALQDFFAKLLRLDALAQADASKGRLRTYLATALQRFLINWRRDQPHRDRECSIEEDRPGGPADHEERYRHETMLDHETPERLYERKWIHELLGRVLRLLGDSYAGRGKGALFATLRPVLIAGGTLDAGESAVLAASVGMTDGALRVALLRLRREYRATLEAEVANTVGSPGEVEDEIAYLLGVFRRE
ncbi:MAG: sigma-70 family RNA polymerase sigma factor [Chthoniobacteraceae bacterium]